MAEQFGIVGSNDQRRTVHYPGQSLDLSLAIVQEVSSVQSCLLARWLGIVGSLLVGAAGDAVILDPDIDPLSSGWQIRAHMVVVEVVADVAVEVAVINMSRIAFDWTSHLLGGLYISTKSRDHARAIQWGIAPVERAGSRVLDGV